MSEIGRKDEWFVACLSVSLKQAFLRLHATQLPPKGTLVLLVLVNLLPYLIDLLLLITSATLESVDLFLEPGVADV